jgi:hypothetical protein
VILGDAANSPFAQALFRKVHDEVLNAMHGEPEPFTYGHLWRAAGRSALFQDCGVLGSTALSSTDDRPPLPPWTVEKIPGGVHLFAREFRSALRTSSQRRFLSN